MRNARGWLRARKACRGSPGKRRGPTLPDCHRPGRRGRWGKGSTSNKAPEAGRGRNPGLWAGVEQGCLTPLGSHGEREPEGRGPGWPGVVLALHLVTALIINVQGASPRLPPESRVSVCLCRCCCPGNEGMTAKSLLKERTLPLATDPVTRVFLAIKVKVAKLRAGGGVGAGENSSPAPVSWCGRFRVQLVTQKGQWANGHFFSLQCSCAVSKNISWSSLVA